MPQREGGPSAAELSFSVQSRLMEALHRAARRGLLIEGEHRSVSQAEEARLHDALDDGELRVFHQPKVALDTNLITGTEALLRWNHPDRGMVPPLEFIPIAEETGLITLIGSWVLEQACRQASMWESAFPDRPKLVMSVNVSARQFAPDLVDVVTDALAHSNLEPSSLCLEVTESVLMTDVKSAIITLQKLADLGVTISIDDFGTGYSSLAYLKTLPIHELKVDKSFVSGLGTDPNDTAIVAAVVAMAHALDLRVVAEGVETETQLQELRRLGCEMAQGYLFARPGPAPAIDDLLMAEAVSSWRTHTAAPHQAANYRPDRVLVVDDAPDARLLARVSLRAVGYEVYEATDGIEAVAMARALQPDCIVLDLVMPDMNGLEVCRTLRRDPTTRAITIVTVTANADAKDKAEAFSCGVDDYIVKPYAPRDLASRVRSALGRRRLADDNLPIDIRP